MLRRILLGSAILLLLAPTMATAQDDEEFTEPGWYLTAYVAGGTEMFRHTGGQSFDDWSIGAGALAGYRANEWISLELQAEWMDGWDGKRIPPGGQTVASVVDSYVATANAKVSLPIWGRFQPFAKYGMGAMVAKGRGAIGHFVKDRTESSFAMRFGTGMDAWITPNVGLTVGVDYVFVDQSLKLDYLPVYGGVTYKF